ncbi:MAG TPA: Crp/Fnr family transcriptional regulator [Candidatus Saccharimonadales bacterium]
MSGILKNPVISSMLRTAKLRSYPKGQTILFPEDFTAHLFILKKGAVTMGDIDDQDYQKILHIFGPPALFPMVSFSEDTVRVSWYYTALTDCEVYLLPYDTLKKRLASVEGGTARNLLLQQLLKEVHELLVRVNSFNKTTSFDKLRAALEFLATHHTKTTTTSWQRVTIPITHQILAALTGLTRETVSITLRQMQEQKLVRYASAGKLYINRTKLSRL